MAVYGKKDVRYQSRKELHHHAVGASRETVIDVEVLFPPAEEGFNVPPQLIDAHDVFGGEIEPVGSQPVEFTIDPVADDPYRLFGLIDAVRAEMHHSIIEHRAAGSDDVFVKERLQRGFPDAADEVPAFRLPDVEALIALVVPVKYPGFTRLKDGGDIRSFIALAVRQVDFHGDAAIEIEPDMGFCLIDVAPVISPRHGERGLDQGPVDGDEVAQMFILERERAAGDPAQFAEHIHHLIQTAGVDGFVEGTLLDTFRGRAGNGAGNIVFFEELQQFLTGTVLFEMKQYQRGELLVECQFQGLVPP